MAGRRARTRLGQLGVIAFALGAGYLAVRLAVPVLAPVAAAGLAALALFPFHERLARRMRGSPSLAAALSSLLVTVVLALPLAAALWTAAQQASAADADPRAMDAALSGRLGREAASRMKSLGLPDLEALAVMGADAFAPAVARSIGALARGVRSAATFAIVFPLALFLFLRDGPAAAARAIRLAPVEERLKTSVVADVAGALSAAVQSFLAVGIVQGSLAAIGFAFFGVRFAVLLGVLSAALSPIPFVGSALVWVPAVVRLALEGESEAAFGLGVWSILAVGLSDNVIRPLILHAKTSVPLPVLAIVLAGGIQAFGLAGTLVGPLLATLVYSLARSLGSEAAQPSARPAR